MDFGGHDWLEYDLVTNERMRRDETRRRSGYIMRGGDLQ